MPFRCNFRTDTNMIYVFTITKNMVGAKSILITHFAITMYK